MTVDATSAARESMAKLHRAPEPEVLKPLIARAESDSATHYRVMGEASGLLADLRAAQNKGWVNQFLQEYQLNSSEGIALLSLAEAFLRVPDPETADFLISDKLGEADWSAHTGKSNSRLVNSATWGLIVGRALDPRPRRPHQGALGQGRGGRRARHGDRPDAPRPADRRRPHARRLDARPVQQPARHPPRPRAGLRLHQQRPRRAVRCSLRPTPPHSAPRSGSAPPRPSTQAPPAARSRC